MLATTAKCAYHALPDLHNTRRLSREYRRFRDDIVSFYVLSLRIRQPENSRPRQNYTLPLSLEQISSAMISTPSAAGPLNIYLKCLYTPSAAENAFRL